MVLALLCASGAVAQEDYDVHDHGGGRYSITVKAQSDPTNPFQPDPRNKREEDALSKQSGLGTQIALSAQICSLAEARVHVGKAINTEHEYSEKVGVANLVRLQHLKELLILVDDAVEQAKSGIQRLGLRPWRCSSPLHKKIVWRLSRCVEVDFTPNTGAHWQWIPDREGVVCETPEIIALMAQLNHESSTL